MSEIKETQYKPIPTLSDTEQQKILQISYCFAKLWAGTDQKEALTPSLDALAGEISRIITNQFNDANQG